MNDAIIESVCYYELADDLGTYYGDFSPVAHTVDIGVEIQFASGRPLSLTWVNPTDRDGGLYGHLAVVEQPMDVVSPFDDIHRYPVADWPQWRPDRDVRLTRVEHLPDPVTEPADRIRIGARLWFDEHPPVTVTLGVTDSTGGLEYDFQQLLVFHDDNVARTYLAELAKRHTKIPADIMLGALHSRERPR